MNVVQKTQFRSYVTRNKESVLRNNLKTGAGRGLDAKQANYREVLDYLKQVGVTNPLTGDVSEAVAIIKEVMGRELEVQGLGQAVPQVSQAAKELLMLNSTSSDVRALINGVDVRLDNDQKKHQHPTVPIGTRDKTGGNRFKSGCDAQWHIDHTLAYMADWALGLTLAEGERKFHGQAKAVDGIHYEGFCVKLAGIKYVLFHCYPSDRSNLKL